MSVLPSINAALEPFYRPYGRKSHKEERHDQRHTEREQRESCLRFVAERIARDGGRGEVAPVPWLFDAQTGRTDQRPAYQQALADVRAARREGRRAFLVVGLLDRLGRDAEELHRCKKELDKLGIIVLAVDFAGEIADEVFPYVVATAHVGSIKISKNVQRINAQFRRDGWWRPARAPWGYQAVPATDAERRAGAPAVVLAIVDAEAAGVRAVYAKLVAGQPVKSVARWLAGEGAGTVGGHQSRDGWRVRNLGRKELRALVRSRLYCGQQPDGGQGKWPALVDVETWDAAQAALAGATRRLPQQASGKYLLTGLLWCPVCAGRGLAVRMTGCDGGSPHGAARYRCRCDEQGARAPHTCYYSVRQADADAAVLAQVQPLLDVDLDVNRADFEREVARQLRAQPDPGAALTARLQAVRAGLDVAKGRRRELMTLLADRVISAAEFTAEVAPYRAEIATGEAALADVEAEVARAGGGPRGRARVSLADVMRQLDTWRAGYLRSAGDTAGRREYVAALVARVVPVRAGKRGAVHCEITWTEEGALLAAAAGSLGAPGQEVAGEALDAAAAG